MTLETVAALRVAADDEFILTFSDALRTQKLSPHDIASFLDELHRRADANREAIAKRDARRRAAIALYEAPAASDSKN